MAADFHKIWIKQCEAARGIREGFGVQKALGYLIGEKLVNFVRAAGERPEFADELPAFLEEVRDIFTDTEIRGYLVGLRRVGAFGHIGTEEQIATLRAAGAIDENPVRDAEDVLIMERIKEMLFG